MVNYIYNLKKTIYTIGTSSWQEVLFMGKIQTKVMIFPAIFDIMYVWTVNIADTSELSVEKVNEILKMQQLCIKLKHRLQAMPVRADGKE